MFDFPAKQSPRRTVFFLLLLIVTAALSLVALTVPLLTRLFSASYDAGQVAPQDILAPRAISYTSEVLTEQRRETAERSISPVFTQPDTTIARQQLERLRTSLAFITSVRSDPYASLDKKKEDLAALEDIHLSSDSVARILSLSDSRWQTVQQEALVVLEQVMRDTVRADRVEDVRSRAPSLVNLSLPPEQAAVVSELVMGFIVPNSFPSERLTEESRLKAREAVAPVTRNFITGETVVRRGQVLSQADVEALEMMGLTQPSRQWQDPVAAGVLALLMFAFIVLYLHRDTTLTLQERSLTVMSILFVAFLFGARLTIPGRTVIPYAYPLAAYGLLVGTIFGAGPALVTSLPLAVMASYGLSNALDLTLYHIMGTFFGVLVLGRARRITSFFWAGAAVAAAAAAVVIVYRLTQPTTDLLGITTLVGAAVFNGLAAASLTLLLQFFLAQFLGMVTPMHLMELTRPDHPLLQMLLHDAPGTYQHSLQIANLAEQAAERIGADALLTRVGALYHDAGKALNPVFFIENQVPGHVNPHDDLDPITSANTILRHVTDGMEIGRKHRLPRRILDFVAEHHGTMITRYQYARALEAAGGDESQVDIEKFRYPGPRPQSRETAILMLADGCEARVRAEKPREEEELRAIIKSVINNRVATGQLDDTSLTLRDLETIQNSFLATLRGIYHPRIEYPKLTDAAGSTEKTTPVAIAPGLPEGEPVARPQVESRAP